MKQDLVARLNVEIVYTHACFCECNIIQAVFLVFTPCLSRYVLVIHLPVRMGIFCMFVIGWSGIFAYTMCM